MGPIEFEQTNLNEFDSVLQPVDALLSVQLKFNFRTDIHLVMLHHNGVFGAFVLSERHDVGGLVEQSVEGVSDLGDHTADLLTLFRDLLDFLEQHGRLNDKS